MFTLKILFSILVTSLLFSAEAFSFEKENWGYGAFYKSGNYTYTDSEADTETTSSAAPGIQIRYNPQIRNRRYLGSLERIDFELDASTDGDLHSDVSGMQFSAGIQQRLNLTRALKVWVGAAYGFGSVDLKNRYTIAEDGFLDEIFPNESESISVFSLSADMYFELRGINGLHWGIGLFSDIPTGDSVEAMGLKLALIRE